MANDVNIFEFADYRHYIHAWLKAQKSQGRSNLSKLATVAQVHPTFLSHVLGGHKQLSLEQAAQISDEMEHSRLEQDYFFILIHLDRAGSKRLKEYWLEKKQALEKEKNKLTRRFEKHRELNTEQRAKFYSSWLYAAIWVSTSINDKQTMNQVATRFNVSKDKAEEVLSFLVETGLCVEKNGSYSMGETHVHVPDDSPFVVKHHMNWRVKAIQQMDSRKLEELFFTCPMALSKDDFKKIREKLNKLIKEAIDLAKASPAEEVICLNIDFFQQS